MSIITGDCLDVMKEMEANSISAIVTDPPYGIKFMGNQWDHGVPGAPFWKEALRISKPGTFLIAFGGTRTYHRLTCCIEDAGWQIRDCIQWIYGNGFPKSHNHFGIEGYGTCLKPAYEPIVMAMKPCEGTFKNNAEKWGQAGINIDASRIETSDNRARKNHIEPGFCGGWGAKNTENHPQGRWPANVILDEEAGKQLDEQSGVLTSGKIKGFLPGESSNNIYGTRGHRNINPFGANSGGASRFFYCAKASASERNEGLAHLEAKEVSGCYGKFQGDGRGRQTEHQPQKNNHPTVKPIKLMKYLIQLVMPPTEGLLLDPFAGSGSTIVAARELGFDAIGIEKSPEYSEIARARTI